MVFWFPFCGIFFLLVKLVVCVVSYDRSIESKPTMRADLTKEGKLGLRLLEDLTALAAGGSVCANKMPQFTYLSFPHQVW